ncbi:MAG: radical SAM protein, partial [Acidobacteria bacterium]|nr:radical SAM protein [Acidobacteriota bacterium]
MANKNILLIEPGYKNKYPPLGLMKIAQYHGPRGKRDRVRFIKGLDTSVLAEAWDRVYVTTLFSFEYTKTAQAIDFALEAANGHADKVFVGGIAASLMHERFLSEPRWQGIRFVKGLLSEPPAVSLQLDDFAEELYSDDIDGLPIEDHVPDYGIIDQIDYEYPVRDAYFAYTTRGCIRKCRFCGVPALEGQQRDTYSLTSVVEAIEKLYGPKKDLILMDNNVVASARFKDIVAEIRDLGFTSGTKLLRKGARTAVQRRVDFNQGVDARILCKHPVYVRELATICIRPLRIAFDHLGLRRPYERAVRYAAEHGLTRLSNYMLYNFHDDPADLFERMRLNVRLNEKLGIRVWSFPMRYLPTDRPDRGHVGEKWTRYQLRSLQLILQATHGVVTGAPEFFKRAFGDTFED